MIDKIHFKNYKSFKENQVLELKPITILIGKNSSGKSAVVKLPALIEASLSGDFEDPILTKFNGIELGAEFRDLIHGREIGSIELSLFENGNDLKVEVTSGLKDSDLPKIRKWKYNKELHLSYRDKENQYYDEITKKSYELKFNGFKLISGNLDKNRIIGELMNLNTNYVGPFREIPLRTYNSVGNIKSTKVGLKGENAYQILISDYLYNDSTLLNKVSKWYEDNFEDWGILINEKSKPDYKIELARKNPAFSINIRDVGEGMTQVLPLVLSAIQEPDKEILTILEQPELHLHPAAHGNLAELFAMSALSSNNKFLIETHSQNFVLRIRRLVAEQRISKADVAMYSVEYNKENNTSSLKKIEIANDGNVSYWPENVFSETLDETLAIRTAQLKR